MVILVEGEDYKVSDLENIIDSRFYKQNGGTAIVDYVGYFYSFKNKEVVYILPKVFIDKHKKVLFEFDKMDLLKSDFEESIQNKVKLGEFKYLLILFYKSLIEYKNRNQSTNLLSKDEAITLNSNIGESEYSYLDIILNIVNFHKKNKSTILFIEKQHKSQQHRKTSWQKTINKTTPILDKDNRPIYMTSHNKKKYIDNAETLLTIFYSVLNYIKQKYKFNVKIDNIYTIYTGKSYDKLMLKAPKILKKIKYKYFSDTLLKIYKLMELYFNQNKYANQSKKTSEFLMVNNYHIIFEDMIDKLFSDKLDNSDLKKLKNQQDGKEVDHLFEYNSLLSENETIFYVGDSKYYKTGNKIEEKSIYKQFTYAKNIIQFNINLLNKGNSLSDNIRYRDQITEGYNISPNFFIQGEVYSDMHYDKHCLALNGDVEKNPNFMCHFNDRLFDRDSLFVHYYNINFLFVLKSYTIFNSLQKSSFRQECKKLFKTSMINYLSKEFRFFEKEFNDYDELESFVTSNFRTYNGRMYRTKDEPLKLKFAISFNNIDDIDKFSDFQKYKL